MKLDKNVREILSDPAYWSSISKPSLITYLTYLSQTTKDSLSKDKIQSQYISELTTIKRSYEEMSEQHEIIEEALASFANEKTSEDVKNFWEDKYLDQKLCTLEKKTKIIEAEGVMNFLQTGNERLNDASKMVHKSHLNFLERKEAKYYEQKENDANKDESATCSQNYERKRRNADDNSQDEYTTPKRRALADDKSYTPCGTDDSYASDESDDGSDEECGSKLIVEEISFDEFIDQEDKPFIFKAKNISSLFKSYRCEALTKSRKSGLSVTQDYREILSISHILLLQVDDYSDMQIKTFSRDTLEDLRKDIRARIFGKEKISKEFKSTFQEYVETVLDDEDCGLDKLWKLIIESYPKTFDKTEENALFLKMQLLFQKLASNLSVRTLKEKISEGTLVANFISPILRIFLHNASVHPTTWPNTASTSAKIRKLANSDPSRAKQPDMIGKVVHNGKFAFELMFGEVTGEGRNNTEKKNIIDLIRLGMFMKDSIDLTLHKANVNCVLFGWQSIVLKWTGYIMVLIAPGVYLMVEAGNIELPKSFDTCSMFFNGLDTLRTFQVAYERTVKEVLSAMNKSREKSDDDKLKQWCRSTLGTPAFKKIIFFK
ncbi:hypothetical protein G9A89_021789 [Geosiphon pyriformis]|nr:hypothetical protein G9A89_021789 [Geosiphon pyriformis]